MERPRPVCLVRHNTPHGKRAVMIKGSGPSKQAISQDVKLPACHYQLQRDCCRSQFNGLIIGTKAPPFISNLPIRKISSSIFSKAAKTGKKSVWTLPSRSRARQRSIFSIMGVAPCLLIRSACNPARGAAAPKIASSEPKTSLQNSITPHRSNQRTWRLWDIAPTRHLPALACAENCATQNRRKIRKNEQKIRKYLLIFHKNNLLREAGGPLTSCQRGVRPGSYLQENT